jgi:hypothetical protein
MITPKIKALFQFIEYLHSNIDNFKQFDEVLNELHLLDKERQKVSSKMTFKDKLKYDEVQEQIKDKFNVIQENILQPIKAKATELNICDLNKTETLWNWNSTEISDLKENFSKDDLPEIFNHKNKYLEFREETKGMEFLGFFIGNLDETLKILFDFFKETEQNEFEAFESKPINAENINEALEYIQAGHKKTSFPLFNSTTQTNKKLYKVSKRISNIKKKDGIEYLNIELENEYILKNKNIYSEQNNLIHEAENPKDYDPVFYLRLKHLNPLYKIFDFLNYHYLNTKDKDFFIRHIKYEILRYFKDGKDKQRVEIINEWLEEKTGIKTPLKVEKKEPDLTSHEASDLINKFDLEFFKKYVEEQKETLSQIDFATMESSIVTEWYKEEIKNGNGNLAKLHKHQLNIIQKYIIEVTPTVKAFPPQPIVKQKPQLNGKLITFKNSETIDKIHSELKGYFPKKEAELLKALQGEQLSEILLFPHNQNKFVEVFRRLKYNGFLLNTDTETKNWICTTFQFVKKGFAEPQPFNESSVWDNLNKGKGEPRKKERICITDWLPYKSPLQLTRETENEKL